MAIVSKDINFDEIFKIMVFAMRFNRCHPDVPRDRKWVCHFLATYGLCVSMFCLLTYSIIFFDIKNGNLAQACSNGTICTINVVMSLHYFVILRYRRNLKSLIDEMKVDYETSKCNSPAEQRITDTYAKRGKKVVYLWLVVALAVGGTFIVKAVVLMIYYAIKGEFRLVHVYELTYPSPVEEMKNEPLVFFIIFGIFSLYIIYATLMYVALAALGPVFMLHACGQLELVMSRLMNIFDKNHSTETTLKKFNDVVKDLQKIYSFLERVQESFKILYELILKAASIILPISIYQIIQSYHEGVIMVEFITVIIGGITISSVPCYYSDQLMDMGKNVRLAVYMCGWESHWHKHKKLRTTLLLLQLRAARTVAIRTIFRTICLDALTNVYNQAYAIFNLLNAV